MLLGQDGAPGAERGRRRAALEACCILPPLSADLWEYYLPYLYSCISLFGVLLLLRKSGSCGVTPWHGGGSSGPFWWPREG